MQYTRATEKPKGTCRVPVMQTDHVTAQAGIPYGLLLTWLVEPVRRIRVKSRSMRLGNISALSFATVASRSPASLTRLAFHEFF
jgi:hypothetical protein